MKPIQRYFYNILKDTEYKDVNYDRVLMRGGYKFPRASDSELEDALDWAGSKVYYKKGFLAKEILKIAKSLVSKNFRRDFVKEVIRKFDAIEKKNVLYIPIEDKYVAISRVVWQGAPRWGILGWFRDSPKPYDYSEDVEHDAVNRFFGKRKYREMPENEDGLKDLAEMVKSLRRTKIDRRKKNVYASSCSLRLPYGGMPTGGGYGSYTEYEIGAQMIAEAAHCILGSIYRSATEGTSLEMNHVKEELGEIKKAMSEYSRLVYRNRFLDWDEDVEGSIRNIKKKSSKLRARALAHKGKIKSEDYSPSLVNVAMNAYDVMASLATAMERSVEGATEDSPEIDNAFGDSKLGNAVKKLQSAIASKTASTSGFMGDYRSKTHDNFFDPSMRVWSYADSETGEKLPLIMTELKKRKWNKEDVIWLSAIASPEKQGTGMASSILKKITNMADKHDVEIWLSPEPFGNVPNKLSASKLKSWYKRYGWVKAGGGTMVRYPE